MMDTTTRYDAAVALCKDIFIKKSHDYGTSWRVLRPVSISDQIYIKAKRIRTIQESGRQLVADGIADEFRGIFNYGVIGMIQLQMAAEAIEELPVETVSRLYDAQSALAKTLMEAKNHDYGEAWREMSQEGLTDLILQKLYRVKQIIRNEGRTVLSEGLDANFMDIMNYAIFALILLDAGSVAALPT